jgi:Xaa-Pro aminopeptidase
MTTANSRSRAHQVRHFLRDQNLDAWIAWRPDELLMLTGYFPFWGASVVIYFADAEPVLFIPTIELPDGLPKSGVRVREYPWGEVKCTDPFGVLIAGLTEELAKAKVKPEKTGMNPSSARISLPMFTGEQIPIAEDFSQHLSKIATVPNAATLAAFAALYQRKSDEEIQNLRRANRVANIGLQAFMDHIKPGTSETEIASAVESVIYRQIGQDGIFHARGCAMVQSGPNSADAGRFNRSTARKLETGDLVLIELGTCVNGYWSDLTRTVPVGQAKPAAAEILSVVTEAQKLAREAVRPGVSAGEIDAVARNFITARGFGEYFTHVTGHHVGFRYHDPAFGIVPGEKSLLEPGMLITVEPGVYVPKNGAGARVEDNALVTDTGHEILSRTEAASKA